MILGAPPCVESRKPHVDGIRTVVHRGLAHVHVAYGGKDFGSTAGRIHVTPKYRKYRLFGPPDDRSLRASRGSRFWIFQVFSGRMAPPPCIFGRKWDKMKEGRSAAFMFSQGAVWVSRFIIKD